MFSFWLEHYLYRENPAKHKNTHKQVYLTILKLLQLLADYSSSRTFRPGWQWNKQKSI